MYKVSVQRDFIAQHFLVGGDWGAENEWHSHHYRLEIELAGSTLDEHGYLLDIVDLEHHLAAVVAQFQDQTLNELEPFAGLNPSLEHFARILCLQLAGRIKASHLTTITTRVWENEEAWASYQHTW